MTRGDWKRVSKGRPCPVCGKSDWCLFAGPDDAPTAAICARVESAKPVGAAGSGWWHRLRDDDRRPARGFKTSVPMRQQPQDVDAAGPDDDGGPGPVAALDLERLAADFRAAVDLAALQLLAAKLGVSVESLQRLRVGWAAGHRAWSFPMTDAVGRVLGIRLRRPNGSKFAVTGGHDGLFLPNGLDSGTGGRLLVCEGPTDTAALLDLGFSAVGRPSCWGGARLLVELVKQRRPAEVCIVADSDAPGQRGAGNLASVLLAYSPAVRIIVPPAGVKDAREWKQRGSTAADLAAAIGAAPVRRLAIVVSRQTRKKGRRGAWKAKRV